MNNVCNKQNVGLNRVISIGKEQHIHYTPYIDTLWRAFANELQKDTEAREGDAKTIKNILEWILRTLAQDHLSKLDLPSSVFPITYFKKEESSLDDSLIKRIVDINHKNNKLGKIISENPELLLRALDIDYEYFGTKRPLIQITKELSHETSKKIENIIKDPHLEYACKHFRNITGNYHITSKCFDIWRNRMIRFSPYWEQFARVFPVEIVSKIQEVYECSKELQRA